MSVENAKQVFESLLNDPKAQELLKNATKPKNEDDIIAAYTDVAAQLGFALTEADIKEALAMKEQEQKERTETAAAGIKELPDDALDKVAGGGCYCESTVYSDHMDCVDTYKDKENCYVLDGCDQVLIQYENYICHKHYYDDSCHSIAEGC